MAYIAQGLFDHTNNDTLDGITDRANQIYQLAKIGCAAQESAWNIAHRESAFCALFEVIGRLGDEIRGELVEIDEVSPDLRKVIEAAQAQGMRKPAEAEAGKGT